MKQKLILAVMTLLLMATGLRAQTTAKTAYVVYDNETLYFLSDDNDNLSTITIDGKEITLTTTGSNINCWKGTDVTNRGNNYPGWISKYKSEIKTVKVYESFKDVNIKNCYCWFIECSNLKELDLSNFNTSSMTNMGYMFKGCSSLESITFGENFSTAKVNGLMSGMFSGCSSLKELDLSSFDTSNVVDMSDMFSGCTKLKTLNLSNFKTDNEYIYDDMFAGSNSEINIIADNATFYVTQENRDILSPIKQNVIITTYNKMPDTPYGDKVDIYTCTHFVIDADKFKIPLSISHDFKADKLTVKRDFKKGNPYTVYFPFSLSATSEDYKLYEYTDESYDEGTGTVTLKEVTKNADSHKAYLLIPQKDINQIEMEYADIKKTPEASETEPATGLIGVYGKKSFTPEEAGEGIYYGWANGKFWRAGDGAKVDACRAYLKLPAKAASGASASLSVKFDGDGTTGIGTIKSDADGDTEAPAYNLQGQRVGADYKGLVIKNGRKVIVK